MGGVHCDIVASKLTSILYVYLLNYDITPSTFPLTGSWKGGGNQYIQLVHEGSHLRSSWDLNFNLRDGRRGCYQCPTVPPLQCLGSCISLSGKFGTLVVCALGLECRM